MAASSSQSMSPSEASEKSEQDFFRDDIVRHIFGNVGQIEDDFSCAVESTILLHGRMYVTRKFICFYSNLFGLEKKIRIPYSHVTCITKENTALVIPNAIAVITHKKEYIFRSFWDREECYSLLTRWHETSRSGSIATANHNNEIANGVASRLEPSRARVNANASDVSNPAEAERERHQRQTTPPPGKLASAEGAKITSPGNNNHEEASADDILYRAPASGVTSRVSKRSSASADLGEMDTDIASSDTGDSVDDEQDSRHAFQKEVEKRKLKTHVANVHFPISVDTFFTSFVADNAAFPFDHYHIEHGDQDVSLTEWKKAAEGMGRVRELKFIKPLSFSMGPSKTKAIKAQLLKRFREHGMVLSTSTRLEDIPSGDCFCVDDVFIVRAAGENECTLEIRLELNFFKSTMWRKFIESATIPETSKWLTEYAHACLEYVANATGAQSPVRNAQSELPPTDARPDITVANPVNMNVVVRSVIVFVLITLFLFGGWNWRSSNSNSEPSPEPQPPFFAAGDFAVWKERVDVMESELKRSRELLEKQQNFIQELTTAYEKLQKQQPDSCPKARNTFQEL